MEKIFDIAKDSEKSWGVIAQGIDRNFDELSQNVAECKTDISNKQSTKFDDAKTPHSIFKANISPSSFIGVDMTVSNELVDVYDEIYKCDRTCVKVNRTISSGRAWITTNTKSPININNCHVSLSFAIGLDTQDDERPIVAIVLFSGDYNDAKHRAILRVYYGAIANYRNGFFHMNLAIKPLLNQWHSDMIGSQFDAENVTSVGICTLSGSQSANVYLSNLEFRENITKGGCLIVIDNMNENVPLMADYAKSKGIECSLSIIPYFIITGKTHSSLDVVKRLKDDGHFIFNHTFSHNISANMTYDEVMQDYEKAARWMIRNGFKDDSRILSNPSAAYPTTRYLAQMNSSVKMIYHHWAGEGLTDKYMISYPEYPMTRLLNITALDSQVKIDNVQEGIGYMVESVRQAVECGGLAVLGFHGESWDNRLKDATYPNNGDGWKALIDQLSQIENVTFYTIEDILEGLYL